MNVGFFIKGWKLGLAIFLISTSNLVAQKIIAFDKSGRVKRVRYYKGELIKLNISSGERIFGTIDSISDSSFTVEGKPIELKEVTRIYNTQKLAGFKFFSGFFIKGGFAYLPLVTVNRAINNDDPIFRKQAAIISGSLLSTGLIFKAIANKSYKISAKRPLKIIDLLP